MNFADLSCDHHLPAPPGLRRALCALPTARHGKSQICSYAIEHRKNLPIFDHTMDTESSASSQTRSSGAHVVFRSTKTAAYSHHSIAEVHAGKQWKETNTTPTSISKDETAQKREAALQKLLSMDNDLRIWLEHTKYFDVDYRNRVLERARVFKAFDERRVEFLTELLGPEASATTKLPCAEPEMASRQELNNPPISSQESFMRPE